MAIPLLLGLAIGSLLGAVLAYAWNRKRLDLVTQARDKALQRADSAEAQLAEFRLATVEVQGEHRERVAQLETDLRNLRESGDEKLQLVTEARDSMRAVLKEAAGEALGDSGKKVVELAQAALQTATVENRETFERERKNVEQIVKPMKDELNKLGVAVDKLDRDRERQHTELGEQMKGMLIGQAEVRQEAAVLSRALRQPHTRGQWGELHLTRVAEVANMSPHCDFDLQTHVDDDGATLRPDMVVNLPGGKHVVVDSKAPLNPYLDACEATDPAIQKKHMELFARGVRAHMKKLASKKYAEQFDTSPDFVVMYVPGDHLFTAALEFDRSLIEDAVKEGVHFATPATLIAMLRTIAYAWQQDLAAETTRDIADLGCTLYERLCTYLSHVQKQTRAINTLVEAHNAGIGSLERSVLPQARKFPELGAVAQGKELPAVEPYTRPVRSLQVRETLDLDVPASDLPVDGSEASGGANEKAA